MNLCSDLMRYTNISGEVDQNHKEHFIAVKNNKFYKIVVDVVCVNASNTTPTFTFTVEEAGYDIALPTTYTITQLDKNTLYIK